MKYLLLALALQGSIWASNDPLKELADDPDCQIIYDSRVGEHQIRWKTKIDGKDAVKSMRLFYDPFTGEKLESRRGELFTTPSKEELHQISQKLNKLRNINEVIQEFGEPDKIWPRKEKTKTTQYDYRTQFETLTLTLKVYDDGRFQPSYSGIQIKRSVEE